MLRFGGDGTIFGGVSVQGNIGLRVVRTKDDERRHRRLPRRHRVQQPPGVRHAAVGQPCRQSALLSDAGDPGVRQRRRLAQRYKASYTDWLPSFNLRFGLDDKNFIRFAYSRALSRPDFGLLRNFVAINAPDHQHRAGLALCRL